MLLYMVAVFTAKGLFCALVDTDDAFDYVRAEKFGIAPDKVLRICCKQRAEKEIRSFGYARKVEARNNHNSYRTEVEKTGAGQRNQGHLATLASEEQSQEFNLQQAFKAADILLHNGGFGLIAVDLSSIDENQLRKVPLTTWFRFAHVADDTQTALIFTTRFPIACSCYSLKLHIIDGSACWSNNKKSHVVDDCCAPINRDTAVGKKDIKPQDDLKFIERYVPHSEIDINGRTIWPVKNLLALQKTDRIVMKSQCKVPMTVLKEIKSDIDIVRRASYSK